MSRSSRGQIPGEGERAVALQYSPGNGAPVIVASGMGHLAEKIVEVAVESGVPVYEDNSLATVLVPDGTGDGRSRRSCIRQLWRFMSIFSISTQRTLRNFGENETSRLDSRRRGKDMRHQYLMIDSRGNPVAHGTSDDGLEKSVWEIQVDSGDIKRVLSHEYVSLVSSSEKVPAMEGRIIRRDGNIISVESVRRLGEDVRRNLRCRSGLRATCTRSQGNGRADCLF